MAKDEPYSSTPVGGSGPCGRLVREALARLATTEVLNRILVQALTAGALAEVPDDPSSFGSFACGPLREVVEQTLGDDAAHAVLADLSPAFTHDGTSASSGVRRRKRASLAAPTEDAPIVVVASAEPSEVDALVSRLKDRAKVVAAYDTFSLLSAAGRPGGSSLTILINDGMPGIRPATLATLARMVPAGTHLITFGEADVHPEERDEPAPPVEWIRLGRVEDIDGVADVCMAFWPSASDDEEPAPGRRVVVAHHDADWRARVTQMLLDAGYVPLTAPDGFMALERCIDEKPSAVIAALEMATLDGTQLAALLHSRFGENAPPVLLVTSGPLPEPPPGAMAVIRSDAIDEDLLPELAVWIGGR